MLNKEVESEKTKSLKDLSDKEKDLSVKITLLEKDLEMEKLKTSNSGLNKLYQQIDNLKSLLELEKNRNKHSKETENPFNDVSKNRINWVSKDEINNKNLYGE
jgi:hypothetical protein